MLWEVPMTNDLGFAYVQLINYYPAQWAILAKILDYRSEVSIKKADMDMFAKIDMLTSHIMTLGRPPQRGDGKWQKLGLLPLTEQDYDYPELKGCTNTLIPPEESQWYVYRGSSLADSYGPPVHFEQVAHLGHISPHINLKFIHHRITMEWMRKLGMNYKSYDTSEASSYFIENQKFEVSATVLYSEVDKSIRGKAIWY